MAALRALLLPATIFTALIGAVLWISAGPVAAHTGFESSNPADGATVGEPIDEIVLTFSGPAGPVGDGFVIFDSSGVTREPDTVVSDDDQLVWTLGFNPPLARGEIGVRWRVQAPDAHPIDGAFSFTVTVPPPAAEPADGAGDQAQAATTVAAEAAPEQQATDEALPGPEDADADGFGASPRTDVADPAAEASRQQLNEFLDQPDISAPFAKMLGALGRLLGLAATMIGIGGIVFVATVARGHSQDLVSILGWVRLSGLLVVLGATVELVAQLALVSGSWTADVVSPTTIEATVLGSFGVALGIRALGGVLLFTAATSRIRSAKRPAEAAALQQIAVPVGVSAGSTIGGAQTIDTDQFADEHGSFQQLPLVPAMSLGILGLLVSYTFDGHTVTEGSRWLTGLVDVVHVAAGAVWVGGVFGLAWILWGRSRRGVRLRALELAVRFSVIAATALAAAGLAGTVLAIIILDSPSELWSTAWGRLLIAKFLAVAAAAGLGAFNHLMVIPWMNDSPDDESRSIQLRNIVTGEAAILGIMVVITAFLVDAAS